MAEEQLDYGDEEFTGGSQKMQYHGDGAIPALADDEIGGEDDEYDDLYNDVNVGEGFLQMHRSEPLPVPSTNIGNGGFHDQKVQQSPMVPQDIITSTNTNTNTPNEPTYPKEGNMTVDLSQNRMGAIPQKPPMDPTNEAPPMVNSNPGQPIPNSNPTIRPIMNENQIQIQSQSRPAGETGGATTLFVGELHWWTTDAELENVLSQYGRVKEIKFFDERASGKSKGYCQVEFYEAGPAAACKEGMNGYLFNGRPCVVAFASPQTIRQMGASYANKNNQNPVQSQEPARRPDGGGRGGANFSGGDSGRGGFGRGGGGNWNGGRGGGVGRSGGGVGGMRGRGGMGGGPKNMNAGGPGFGYGGPGFAGPPGGFMHPMGGGFDPTYMGRGGGYGGFPGGGFPGMMPNFPGMGIAGVAPHVNPAFFGRGMGGMMGGGGGGSGMEGPQWGDTSMGGQWGGGGGGEENNHGQRTRESSYGGEDGGSEYNYTEEKGSGAQRSNTGREKEREREREWSGNSEKRHREEREYEKDYKYKEEKDSYREHRHNKDRSHGHEDEWERGQSSTRSRSRSRAEDHHRSRSRDADYGKRRRSMRSD